MRKTKNRYYENLNEKSAVGNKLFWNTVKPLLSDEVAVKDEFHLTENNKLAKTDPEIAEVLNNFFFQYRTESWYLKIFKQQTFSK